MDRARDATIRSMTVPNEDVVVFAVVTPAKARGSGEPVNDLVTDCRKHLHHQVRLQTEPSLSMGVRPALLRKLCESARTGTTGFRRACGELTFPRVVCEPVAPAIEGDFEGPATWSRPRSIRPASTGLCREASARSGWNPRWVRAVMPLMKLRDHLAGFRVEGGKQRRRAVTRVIVRAPLDLARLQRQQRLRPVERWICGFSSTQNTTAWSGGSNKGRRCLGFSR